jgi:3-hydroxyisobutyrate dehydrogenase/2-hydroxy-3-oxopropionate reductase
MLSRLGRIVETGGLGSATGAKLVANATLFGVLGALGEALVLADRLGLDRETAWRVLATTPLAAQAERRRPAVESGEFPSRFGVGVARKDAELIKAVGGDLRVLEAARSWLADAEATDPDRDYSAVLAEILRQG